SDLHVIEQRDWIVSEIHQNLSHLIASMGLCMHRESPLADERCTWGLVRNLIGLRPFNGEAIKLLRRYVTADHDVIDDRHVQTVDFRYWATQRLRVSRSPAPDQSADQRRDETRTSCTQQSTSRRAQRSGGEVTGAKQHVRLLRVLHLASRRRLLRWCAAMANATRD